MRALLASRNENKLRELRAALPGWDLDLAAADEYPPENADTYYGNARAKALHALPVASDAWVLGEDSGIEVAALAGRPGVESARWAEDGVAALLVALAGVADRSARYVCELVAVSPGGTEVRATGTVEGTIAHQPRGSEGFGYDPIFVPAGEARTVAELGNDWKARNSHRARAAAALAAALERK